MALFKSGTFIITLSLCILVVLSSTAKCSAQEPPWQSGSYDPAWKDVEPKRIISLKYEATNSPEKNGQRLFEALQQLQPGDRLEIASGNYIFTRKVTLDLQGTREAPIQIVAADMDAPPKISRVDARQNLLNIGERNPCSFLSIRGLKLTGGSVTIRFGRCSDIWLDRCELSHSEHGGITANTHDCSRLFITRNHLHHFLKGTGEAMYLGANNGKSVMSHSVIALNHVHDCSGSQGDGIEVKQGSYNNWIVENEIHDTKYPCLIAYGTNGKGINLIERNVLYRSQNQTLQVQGEAIIRNNLIMAAKGDGFSSTDHQAKTHDLKFIHNTIVTSGRGVNLSSWGGREGMVFANNVIYSRDNLAIRFPSGCEKVIIAGNVILGGVQGCSSKTGFHLGRGLNDFKNITWDGNQRNAHPVEESTLADKVDQRFTVGSDLLHAELNSRVTAGAVE